MPAPAIRLCLCRIAVAPARFLPAGDPGIYANRSGSVNHASVYLSLLYDK